MNKVYYVSHPKSRGITPPLKAGRRDELPTFPSPPSVALPHKKTGDRFLGRLSTSKLKRLLILIPRRKLPRPFRLAFEGVVDKFAASAIECHHTPLEAGHFVIFQLKPMLAIGAGGLDIFPKQHRFSTSFPSKSRIKIRSMSL